MNYRGELGGVTRDGHVEPPPLGSAGEARAPEAEDDKFHEVEAVGAAKARMIDWLQCCKLPVAFSLIGFLIVFTLVDKISKGAKTLPNLLPTTREDFLVAGLAVAFVILGPLAFFSQILGVAFNAARDRLSYPLYVFRRTVRLSEIHDANSQTMTKPAFQITNTIIGLVSVGQIKGLGTTKRYFVNMSGDFGARRIVFHTKYKRDQFLSLLRSFAPQCRITRWY